MSLPNSASTSIVSAPPCGVSAGAEDRWFSDEVHVHDAQLKAYLRGSFPDMRDVEDVVQESYLRILRRRAVEPIHSAKAFLFQTARHLAFDFRRRVRASPIDGARDVRHLTVLDGHPDVAETVSRQEKIRLLADAIHTLPRRCREIFVLRRLQGVPQKEVAAQLGLSERTVEVQVQNGLRRCEEFLRSRGVRGFFDHDAT